MEVIKKNIVLICGLLVLIVLILIRSTGVNHFKSDARKWAEPSVKQTNTITKEQLGTLQGQKLIINLNKQTSPTDAIANGARNIPSDSILYKKYLNFIIKHNGPIVLFSDEKGESARIWMLLSQMGRHDIYILIDSSANEVLKYKFIPDTVSSANL
jgi:3-mercaptopyruvate sulfurtransferase SseA